MHVRTLILPLLAALLPAQSSAPHPHLLTAAQWREDVDFLAQEMPKRHKNLFHEVTSAAFNTAVARLRQRIPELDDLQIAAEITKLGAMIGDAHTGISATRPELRFPALPLRLYIYSDGVFVQAAPPELREVVGARVTRIGNTPIERVMELIPQVTDHSNASTVNAFAVYRMVRPALLQSLGIIDDVDHVPFTFDIHGTTKTVTLTPMPRKSDGNPSMGGISFAMGAAPGSGWADARDGGMPPLYLQHPSEMDWFEYLPEQKALFIECKQVSDGEKETLKAFFERAYAEADARHAERLILDLRLNGGGDNTLLLPIVHGIIKRDVINQKGHLFVITGRLTQSAAQNLVNLLEKHTNVTFAGEPTGERPNHYGEGVPFELPHSKMRVNVSTLWWQDLDPRDTRDATKPQLAAPLSSADYAANRDPVLEAIMKAMAAQ
jgi:hypothetical protein